MHPRIRLLYTPHLAIQLLALRRPRLPRYLPNARIAISSLPLC
jgi:hypothetical protein